MANNSKRHHAGHMEHEMDMSKGQMGLKETRGHEISKRDVPKQHSVSPVQPRENPGAAGGTQMSKVPGLAGPPKPGRSNAEGDVG